MKRPPEEDKAALKEWLKQHMLPVLVPTTLALEDTGDILEDPPEIQAAFEEVDRILIEDRNRRRLRSK